MDKRELLIQEISAFMKELGLEDLGFLKNQAEVLLHNRKVLEEREERLRDETEDGDKAPSGKKGTVSAKKAPARKPLSIEQSDNPRYFNICSGDSRIFMDRHEIKALFRIASAASGIAEAGPRLYRWLKKERSDVLGEARISGSSSPVLGELYAALIDNFTAD